MAVRVVSQIRDQDDYQPVTLTDGLFLRYDNASGKFKPRALTSDDVTDALGYYPMAGASNLGEIVDEGDPAAALANLGGMAIGQYDANGNGLIDVAAGGTGVATAARNLVFAGPMTGGPATGAPVFRVLGHEELANLTTGDPHTQYVSLAARAASQTVFGGLNVRGPADFSAGFVYQTNAGAATIEFLEYVGAGPGIRFGGSGGASLYHRASLNRLEVAGQFYAYAGFSTFGTFKVFENLPYELAVTAVYDGTNYVPKLHPTMGYMIMPIVQARIPQEPALLARGQSGQIAPVVDAQDNAGATKAALYANGRVRATGGLEIGNTAAATTPGSVVRKMEVFDGAGVSLGYVPIYSAIS